MKNKIAAYLLLVGILLTTCIPMAVTAEEITLTEAETEKITLMNRMGIIDVNTVEDTPVKRGEFAAWVMGLSGMRADLVTPLEKFTDVPVTHQYAAAVTVAYTIGYMNGISDNEFGVSKDISRTDAMVTLVRLLGYDALAKRRGGYPDGYVQCAAGLSLYKGIDADEACERKAILMMCYNALTAKFVNTDDEVVRGDGLMASIHNVYKVRGTVTANRFTQLNSTDMRLKANEIEIDGAIYKTQDIAMAELLGESVSGYYFYDEKEDERHLLYLTSANSSNEKIVIPYDKIISAASNEVTYENEKEDIKTIKMRSGFTFVLNNRLMPDRKTSDLKLSDGELILLDTDSDGRYELAKAIRPEVMVLRGVDTTEDLLYCREGNVYTYVFDKNYYSEIIRIDDYTGAEKAISIDELTAGDVLTVYRSADERYLKIYATAKKVYGIITQISDEKVLIDGTEYDLPLRTARSELAVGAKVTFNLDRFGRLVYMEEEQDNLGPRYGYFFDYRPGTGLGGAAVKILAGDDKLTYPLANTVKVDDSSSFAGKELTLSATLFDSGTVKKQLVRYRVNSKGEIDHFYTTVGNAPDSIKKLDSISKASTTKYYQWDRIWAGQYKLPTDNFFMVVPTVGDEPNDEELYSTTYTFGADVNDCNVEIYDVDDDNKIGALLLYSQDPLKGVVQTTVNTDVGVFIRGAKGEDNEIAYLWSNGEEKSYEVNGDNIPDISVYSFGDVVRYVVGADGRISTLYTMLDVGATGENTPKPTMDSDTYDHHFFGRVYKKLEDYFVIIPNKDNPTFDTSMDKRILLPGKNSANCAVVDMRTRKVTSATYSSVPQYFEGDEHGVGYVYVRVYKWTANKDLFIYKF